MSQFVKYIKGSAATSTVVHVGKLSKVITGSDGKPYPLYAQCCGISRRAVAWLGQSDGEVTCKKCLNGGHAAKLGSVQYGDIHPTAETRRPA